jgi:hypothetical protein
VAREVCKAVKEKLEIAGKVPKIAGTGEIKPHEKAANSN